MDDVQRIAAKIHRLIGELERIQAASARAKTALPFLRSALGELEGASIPDSAQDPFKDLSDRERQITCLLSTGLTTKEVAGELNLSIKTVSTYRTRALRKLELRTTNELVAYATRHRLTA